MELNDNSRVSLRSLNSTKKKQFKKVPVSKIKCYGAKWLSPFIRSHIPTPTLFWRPTEQASQEFTINSSREFTMCTTNIDSEIWGELVLETDSFGFYPKKESV